MNANDSNAKFQIFLQREENHEYSIKDGTEKFYVLSNSNESKNFQIFETSLDIPTKKEEWKVKKKNS